MRSGKQHVCRKPGEEVWRLRDRAGRVQSCELRDNTQAGAGCDVMLLENGEPLFSRRCADEGLARYVAASTTQDLLRTGWADAATRGRMSSRPALLGARRQRLKGLRALAKWILLEHHYCTIESPMTARCGQVASCKWWTILGLDGGR